MFKLILIGLLFLGQIAFSQNLVHNSDFEINNGIPTKNAQWWLAEGWTNLNGYTLISAVHGSPDYFHTEANSSLVKLPNTFSGTVNPYSGKAAMGLACWITVSNDFREYIGAELTSPMKVGKEYNVSFYVGNGIIDSAYMNGGCGVANFGIHFAVDSVHQIRAEPLNIVPQFKFDNILYHEGWKKVEFTFLADQPYSFFVIGNFEYDSEQVRHCFHNLDNPGVYYFVDGFEIFDKAPCNITLTVEELKKVGCDRIGGETGEAIVSASGEHGPFSYEWNTDPVQSDSFAVGLLAGDYEVKVTDSSGCIQKHKISIKENIEVSAQVKHVTCSTCEDGEATVIVEPGSGTPPFSYRWNDVSEQTTATATGLSNGLYKVLVTDSAGCFDEIEVIVGLTGISSKIPLELKVYPNPTMGKLNIRTNGQENKLVEAYDRFGRSVFVQEIEYSKTKNNLVQIDLSGLDEGVYFISIKGNQYFRIARVWISK